MKGLHKQISKHSYSITVIFSWIFFLLFLILLLFLIVVGIVQLLNCSLDDVALEQTCTHLAQHIPIDSMHTRIHTTITLHPRTSLGSRSSAVLKCLIARSSHLHRFDTNGSDRFHASGCDKLIGSTIHIHI